MRKKLSIMLAAITVLALMAAGPGVAQVEPDSVTEPPFDPCQSGDVECVTVCFTQDTNLSFGFFSAGTTARVPADLAPLLVAEPPFDVPPFEAVATRGPCNDGGGGGGGTGGGGGVEITQEGEQEAEAGEIDQSFDVS